MWRTAFVLFLVVCTSSTAHAARRVALVLGNAAYKHAGVLANPINDARDIGSALKSLNFQVLEGFDLDKSGTERKIGEFAAALEGAEAGLFFYSGHGLQVAGQNYLVPVDAQLSTAAALELEMVRLDVIHRIMEHSTNSNILILDACRNNPLARNLQRALGARSVQIGKGLAVAHAGVGTLIAFSTQPDNVALDGDKRNSPFTGSLVKQLSTSLEDLNSILIAVRNDVVSETHGRQVPWEHSALMGRFYFRTPAPSSHAVPGASPSTPMAPAPVMVPTTQSPVAPVPPKAQPSEAETPKARGTGISAWNGVWHGKIRWPRESGTCWGDGIRLEVSEGQFSGYFGTNTVTGRINVAGKIVSVTPDKGRGWADADFTGTLNQGTINSKKCGGIGPYQLVRIN